MAATLSLLTYNTHLFGHLADVPDIWSYVKDHIIPEIAASASHSSGSGVNPPPDTPFIYWWDEQRKESLKQYLRTCPASPDLIALEEVWAKDYAEDFKDDLAKTHDHHGNAFPNSYPVSYSHAGDNRYTNESGLILLASGRFSQVGDPYHFGYRHDIKKRTHVEPDGSVKVKDAHWDKQDTAPGTSKGYRGLCLQFELDGQPARLGFFATHMPTNVHSYSESMAQCYLALGHQVSPLTLTDPAALKNLNDQVSAFRSAYPDAPVLLLGDFNLSEGVQDGVDFYSQWVQAAAGSASAATLQQAGLADAWRVLYPDAAAQPGYTVDGTLNTFWQHLNPGKTSRKRIDYVMCCDSADGTVKFDLSGQNLQMQVLSSDTAAPPSNVARPQFSAPGSGNVRDDSDHFPLWARVTLVRTSGS